MKQVYYTLYYNITILYYTFLYYLSFFFMLFNHYFFSDYRQCHLFLVMLENQIKTLQLITKIIYRMTFKK